MTLPIPICNLQVYGIAYSSIKVKLTVQNSGTQSLIKKKEIGVGTRKSTREFGDVKEPPPPGSPPLRRNTGNLVSDHP